MKIEFTLVQELKIGEVVKVTIGYDISDNPRINVSLNTENHTAEIKSNILLITFNGINSSNIANSTLITINLLGSTFFLIPLLSSL